MSHLKSAFLERAVLAVLLMGCGPYVHAQSPYGLAARQTIPFVMDYREFEVPVWATEIDIHNPGSQTLTVRLTYFGGEGVFSEIFQVLLSRYGQPHVLADARVRKL